MAVYTQLGAETMAAIIAEFGVGPLVSAKGIAEGVSNSNWLIETEGPRSDGASGPARFILTMYEKRLDLEDLPFFLGLLDHLAARGCPVPRTIHDSDGNAFRLHEGKALALIEFLPGVSVSDPTPAQAEAVGAALAQIHLAAADFPMARANGLGLADWVELAEACGADGLHEIDPRLDRLIADELVHLAHHWPRDLPQSVIHADLFPDNVLILGDRVSGLIDFYFACTDMLAYDLAICLNAWCFEPDHSFNVTKGRALLQGYTRVRALSEAEASALPTLARGAALRFLLTRLVDWLDVPPGALVRPKDPLEYFRKLRFHQKARSVQDYGVEARELA